MKKKYSGEQPKTAVIYVRVSSKEQVDGYSLNSQEKACREYCEKNGWDVLKFFREEGESAKTTDRTQLTLMKDFCIKNIGRVGYLVIWKVDRFARSQTDHFELKLFFSKLGIELKSASESIENTASGRAVEGMLAVMAQLENDIKTDRTLTGMKAKALDGYWPMKAPWGYENIRDTLGRKVIVPDAETAPVVKFLFTEFAKGTIRMSDLTRKASKKWNVKSQHGLKLSKQLVYKTLRKPIHCGLIVVHKWGVSVQGKHEAIVSKKLFQEVQDLLDGKKPTKETRNRDNPDFLLRGVLCDACGGSMTGGFSTGKLGKRYPYYNCLKKECLKRGAIKRLDMEDDFTEFLQEITPDDKVLDALGAAISVVFEREAEDVIVSSRAIDSELKKLEKEQEELLQMRLDGALGNIEYANQIERRKTRQHELELQKQSIANPESSVEADVRFGIRIVKELPVVWPMLEAGELRVLRGLLFPQNLRYQRPKFKTLQLSPIYGLKTSNTDDVNRYVTPRGIEPRFPA